MSTHTLDTTDESFDAEVLQSSTPVLVDFWAPWCGPCRALAPTIEDFAAMAHGKVKVVKHNTQDHELIASRYNVSAIPTLMIFQKGQVVHRMMGGGRSVEEIKKVLSEHAGVTF